MMKKATPVGVQFSPHSTGVEEEAHHPEARSMPAAISILPGPGPEPIITITKTPPGPLRYFRIPGHFPPTHHSSRPKVQPEAPAIIPSSTPPHRRLQQTVINKPPPLPVTTNNPNVNHHQDPPALAFAPDPSPPASNSSQEKAVQPPGTAPTT